ncbi:MAG: hypothetical protein IT381_01760 [Deltaproteobacteria bacterium]|nr:hypothetical protein [Deltaproteobacteria bacterium]
MLVILFFAAFEVDPAMQRIAEDALSQALTNKNVAGGIVLIGDPNDGRVLAVAGMHRSPLDETITIASLAKTFVVAAALDGGTTTAGAMHDCTKGGGLGDWKAFGSLSSRDTLVFSSNVCSYDVASQLGAPRMQDAFTRFGFSTAAAALTDYAVGSIRVSPLEVLQAYGAIANGGELLAPKSATDRSGKVVVRRVLSEKTAREVRGMLALVVTEGTAKSIAAAVPALAGKTGSLEGGSGASFVGYAPAESPRIVALVYLDGNGAQIYGGSVAAPVFARVSAGALALRQ